MDDGEAMTGGGHLRYVDVRSFVLPAKLDELEGPVRGEVCLPRALAWGPRRVFDLGDPTQRRLFYELVVQEASSEAELREYLDRAVLIELWPLLALPRRCRATWEERFPELARCAVA